MSSVFWLLLYAIAHAAVLLLSLVAGYLVTILVAAVLEVAFGYETTNIDLMAGYLTAAIFIPTSGWVSGQFRRAHPH